MNTKEKDSKYIMHTYGRYNVALKSGKGAAAFDEDGKRYIDVSSGIGVNSLGYCDEGWVNAITAQANTCFGNSGAEANECAIKVARKYSFDRYGEGRNVILTLKNSFHGRTVTTLSATGQDVFHNFFFPFTEGFKYAEANNLDDVKNNIDEKVCAVMIEVVQGEGGVVILDKEFVQGVARICKASDILLIIDEVQTGIGRTGKLFAYQHYGVKPDLVTMAKGLGGGLPIGVCLCGEKLDSVMSPSTHGTTFGANPVVCAGANYVIDKISDEAFLNAVEEKGAYLEKKLLALDEVKSVNRLGLMVGIEIDGDAHDMAEKCVANGLLIITAKALLRMLPPLTITAEELDEAVTILEKTLKENTK